MALPTLQASAQGSINGASTQTISITVPAGSNQLLVVKSSCPNSSDYISGATVTHNGTSMGSNVVSVSAGNLSTAAWVLAAPAQGTFNVVITPTASAFLDTVVEVWEGVDQSTPVDGVPDEYSTGAPGASPLVRTITVSSTQVLTDYMSLRTTGNTIGPSGTRIGTQLTGGTFSTASASYTNGSASSSSWTYSSAPVMTFVGLVLNEASGGGGGGLSIPVVMNQYRQRSA